MVNGSRRYSADLLQGGLEIPCILTFRTNNAKLSDNSKKLIEASLAMNIKILLVNKKLANGSQFAKFANFSPPIFSHAQYIEFKVYSHA